VSMRRGRCRLATATAAACIVCAAVVPGAAQAGQRDDPKPGAQASGGELVHYDMGNGVIDSTWDVPGSSGLSRGRASGAPEPCGTYPYMAAQTDPLHPNYGKIDPRVVNPDTGLSEPTPGFYDPYETKLPSTMWEFTEELQVTPVANKRQLQELYRDDYDPEGWHRYNDSLSP
jgi:hypothetical protein